MFDANATGFVYVANSGGQDISVFELGADGGLRARDSVAIQRPIETGKSIVLTLSPDSALLYAGYVSAESRASRISRPTGPAVSCSAHPTQATKSW